MRHAGPVHDDLRPVAVPGLSVRDEAAQLLFRYAELVDDGDLAGVGRLLAGAVVVLPDGTEVARGADAVTRLYEATTRRHADGTPRTQHVVTNVIVEPLAGQGEGERYQVRARFTVLQATDELPLQVVAAGRYRDVVARGDGGRLAIVEHGMDLTHTGDLSAHLRIDPPT